MRPPVPALWMLAYCTALSSCRDGPIYHNQFAVRIPSGRRQADAIAARHGFTNLGQIGKLPGYYLFEHQHVHKRSLTPSDLHHHKLASEPEVHWVQQQHEKVRKKRDFISFDAPEDLHATETDVFDTGPFMYAGFPSEPGIRRKKTKPPLPGRERISDIYNEKEETKHCKAQEHFNTSITGDSHANWCTEYPSRR